MSVLNQVKTKKILRPISVLFYGVHGIGKTSFAAGAESPIFIGVESNDEFDVPRFPKITEWAQLKEQLSALIGETHDFKTVVIDTIDGLEDVAQSEILKKCPGKNMETAMGGYGKAYAEMADMFIDIRDNFLEKILSKGMQVILLAHSEKTKFEDPLLAISYDTYSTSCHKKIKPIFQDWVQAILFANYNLVKGENNQGKEYAVGFDGERVIYTEERPSHVGKNRFGLPYEMPFPKDGAYVAFKNLVSKFYGKPNDEKLEILRAAIMAMTEKIEDGVIKAGAQKSVKSAKDEQELERIKTKIENL